MSSAAFEAILDLLADRLADRLLARTGGVQKVVYSTSKRGPHIPGKSRTWMLRHVRTMPGARRVGRDWCIDATDFDRWATVKDAAAFKAPALPRDVESLAASFLSNAGYRSTKKVA